jgi:hypothetical protein
VGRYEQVDPVDRVSSAFSLRIVLTPENVFSYAFQRPTLRTDPLGLMSGDPEGCVTRWTVGSAALGAGIGGVAGAAIGGASAGGACTFVAPGVGTLGCGAAGGAAGAGVGSAGGAAVGSFVGAIIGTLACECEDAPPLPRVLPKPDKGEIDCREIGKACREKCTDETIPTGTLDGAPFFKCLRECLDSFGC